MNLTNWSFKQKPKRATDLLVLLAISDCIVCSGINEVKINRIELSNKCSLTVAALVNSIKALTDADLISVVNRGSGRVSIYSINCPENLLKKVDKVTKFRLVSKALVVTSKDKSETFTEYTDAFTYAYSNYPRKVGKFQAFLQYQKLTSDEQRELNSKAAQITRFYARTDNKYIPHLATFISQKRFHDDLVVVPDKINNFNDVLFQCAKELSELSEHHNDNKQMVEWSW